MAVYLIDQLKQKNNGKFPLIDANDALGGYYIKDSIQERDNIPLERRRKSMLCWVNGVDDDSGVLYQLIGGIENKNWKISPLFYIPKEDEDEDDKKNVIPDGYSLVWIGDTPPEDQNMLWIDTSDDGIINDEKDIDTINELLALVKEMKNEISSLKKRVKYLEEHGVISNPTEEEEIFEYLLFENGDEILLEDDSNLILEKSSISASITQLLLENGDDLLLEDGNKIII